MRLRIGYPAAAALAALLALVIVVPAMVIAANSGPAVPPPAHASTSPTRSVKPGNVALPVATGAARATTDPALIGLDPHLIHLGVDTQVLPELDSIVWQTQTGRESIEAAYGDGASIALTVYQRESEVAHFDPHTRMQSTREITINGRPATLQRFGRVPGTPLPTWTLYWQPVPGLWAGANAADASDTAIRALAASLSVAKTYRCAQPLTVTVPPAGARLVGCRTGLAGPAKASTGLGVWWNSVLSYTGGVEIALRPFLPAITGLPKEDVPANTEVAGQPAQWDAKSAVLRVYPYDTFFDLSVTGLPLAEAAAVAGGLRLTDDLSSTESWG